jgi:hypothetical protein
MSEQHNVSIRINDKPVELPKGHYTGADLKKVGQVPENEVLYRVAGHELHEVHDDKSIEVHAEEWFVSHAHTLTIFINEKPVHLVKGHYTGSALKQAGKVPSGDILYRIHGHERFEVKDSQTVEIHEHERFVSVPQVGGAS